MIDVIKGFAAIRVGRYWIGVAAGNRYCKRRRKSTARALADARLRSSDHIEGEQHE